MKGLWKGIKAFSEERAGDWGRGLKPGFLGRETPLHPEYSRWSWYQKWEKEDAKVVMFRCSENGIAIVLTETGEVWQFPEQAGGDSKRLSFENEDPDQVGLVSERRIIKISSGEDHFMALDEDGRVWTWADSGRRGFSDGRLGHGRDVSLKQGPQVIEDGVLSKLRAIDVECGSLSSYALTLDGFLYGWGYNWHCQVKEGTVEDILEPSLISEDVTELFSLGSCCEHVFFRKNGGEIGSMGHNGRGQLGTGSTQEATDLLLRTQLGPIDSSEVKYIFSNWHASFVLTTQGEVYSAGELFYCGRASASESYMERASNYYTKLPFSEGIVNITCGHEHTLFMTETGKFYYCGAKEHSRICGSIRMEPSFGTVSLLPELSIPEIASFNLQSTSNDEIPFKLHSGWYFDISLLPNLMFQGLLMDDMEDFDF